MPLTQIKAAGIAADAIDETKIADNGIDSEHYNDGSIDHEHLANDAVDADILADNSVGLAAMAHGTDGQIITYDASGAPVAVGPGTDGQVLTSTGAGSPPAFEAIPASGAASNVVINGEMRIAQRGTSFASVTATGQYPVDRFAFHLGTCGTWTVSQDTDVPTAQGFVKSIKCDVTTADSSLGSGDYCRIDYRMEGQDVQRFRKGTANAKDFALSFWVKSPKTGTHIVELQDSDNNRGISTAYTVSSADTWEKKEIVISKDTTGALDNDNAKSLQINWWMAAGSGYTSGSLATSWATVSNANRAVGQVNCADNTANNFYLTGVQLEVGTVTSDYAFQSTGDELARCQRYFEKEVFGPAGGGYYAAASSVGSKHNAVWKFAVTKRAQPTMTAKGNVLNSSSSAGSCTLFTGLHSSQLYNGTATWYWQGSDGDDIFWASAEI